MTIPPKYSDIGKEASDLFSKDYPIGCAKLEVKSTTSNNVTFTVSGNQDAKSGAVVGELKSKWTDKARGITATETVSHAGQLTVELESADSVVKGLKLSLNGAIAQSGQKNTKVGVEYKQDYLFSNVALDVFKGPTASADAVIGADGFLAGAEVSYNINDGKISKYGAALGYVRRDYSVSLFSLNNFSTFATSYHHRVSSDVEVGGKAVWDKKNVNGNVAVEIGGKIVLDKNTFVKAKVNNSGILGLGYTQTLRPGVKVSLGGSFDTARFQDNVHKLGVSMTLEA